MSEHPFSEAQLLSPELKVLDEVSPLWSKRFDDLAMYIWEHLDQPLPVEELAEKVHLSVYHFHRMFGSAFGESLGSYIRRARLIKATSDLMETEDAITDIAFDCGFSSSQALAKALKKQTGMTPTEIRQAKSQPGMDVLMTLHSRLGRPSSSDQTLSQEQKMAEQLEFKVHHYSDRYFYCEKVEKATFDNSYKVWKNNTPDKNGEMVALTFAEGESMAFEDMDVWVGDACDEAKQNFVMPEGNYLLTRISLTSTLGYFSAWEAMGKYLMKEGLEPDEDSPLLEITHNPTALFAAVDLTLSIRLKH